MPHSKRHIILMYISEVSGHHSATIAIERAIRILDPQAEILNINAFNYTNPVSEKVVNRLYTEVIKKTPKVWDYLYDNPNVKKGIDRFKEIVHRLNSPKLKALFDRFNPDVIACSQAFPCGMVADFKKTCNSNISLVAVLTDYIPHSYWIYDTVDYFISPCEEVTQRFIKKNVPSEKIKTYGIPFDPRFNQSVDKQAVIKKLNLVDGLPTILIMGGGQGFGPISTIINLLDKSNVDFQEIITTGSNYKLYKLVNKRLKHHKKRIKLLSFADNVDELMAVSDLIITKPGGITTAEALAKNLPMVIVNPIPGQEQSNTRYLIEKGAAVSIENIYKISAVIEDLLSNPKKIEQMSECASKISKPDSASDIAKLLLDLCINVNA